MVSYVALGQTFAWTFVKEITNFVSNAIHSVLLIAKKFTDYWLIIHGICCSYNIWISSRKKYHMSLNYWVYHTEVHPELYMIFFRNTICWRIKKFNLWFYIWNSGNTVLFNIFSNDLKRMKIYQINTYNCLISTLRNLIYVIKFPLRLLPVSDNFTIVLYWLQTLWVQLFHYIMKNYTWFIPFSFPLLSMWIKIRILFKDL